ncbi:MAG: hypothetical protein QXD89_00400 [Candidatus Aenigmatarchaeota archaeon]
MIHQLENLCSLIEILGKFGISLSIRKKRPAIFLSFRIGLDREDREMIDSLRKYFGGEVIENKKVFLIIRKIEECYELSQFLKKCSFSLPSKKKKIEEWIRAVEIVRSMQHLRKEGFLELCRIKDEIYGSNFLRRFEGMIERGELVFEKYLEKREKISKRKRFLSLLEKNMKL